jgi:hypothetical protein
VLIPQGESQNCARFARKAGWGSDGPGNAARQIFPSAQKQTDDSHLITLDAAGWAALEQVNCII